LRFGLVPGSTGPVGADVVSIRSVRKWPGRSLPVTGSGRITQGERFGAVGHDYRSIGPFSGTRLGCGLRLRRYLWIGCLHGSRPPRARTVRQRGGERAGRRLSVSSGAGPGDPPTATPIRQRSIPRRFESRRSHENELLAGDRCPILCGLVHGKRCGSTNSVFRQCAVGDLCSRSS